MNPKHLARHDQRQPRTPEAPRGDCRAYRWPRQTERKIAMHIDGHDGQDRRLPCMKEVGCAHRQPHRTGRKTVVLTDSRTGQNGIPPRMKEACRAHCLPCRAGRKAATHEGSLQHTPTAAPGRTEDCRACRAGQKTATHTNGRIGQNGGPPRTPIAVPGRIEEYYA